MGRPFQCTDPKHTIVWRKDVKKGRVCLECRRERNTRWREANPDAAREWRFERESMIATIKIDRGCIDCGYNENPAALDFDHVRGEKLAGIGQLRGTEISVLMAEIDKCEVRCANCHRISTAERKHKESLAR